MCWFRLYWSGVEFLKLVILKLNPKLESHFSAPVTDLLNLGSKVSWCMPIIVAFGRLRQGMES